jgi:hypothetical protein
VHAKGHEILRITDSAPQFTGCRLAGLAGLTHWRGVVKRIEPASLASVSTRSLARYDGRLAPLREEAMELHDARNGD